MSRVITTKYHDIKHLVQVTGNTVLVYGYEDRHEEHKLTEYSTQHGGEVCSTNLLDDDISGVVELTLGGTKCLALSTGLFFTFSQTSE